MDLVFRISSSFTCYLKYPVKIVYCSRVNRYLPSLKKIVWAVLFSKLTGGKYILQLFTLWTWLPVRITMYQPVLLYTTEEHGCSLTTFYVRVEQHEPTLLMIKTCNNEVWRHLLLYSSIKNNGCYIYCYGWFKILWLKALWTIENFINISTRYKFLHNWTCLSDISNVF